VHTPPPVECLGFLAWTLGLQGHEAESLRYLETAVRRAEELRDAFSLASALNFGGVLHAMRRDFAAAGMCAERQIAIARAPEHHFPHFLGTGIWIQGRVLAAKGHPEEGLKLMGEGLAMLMASGGLATTYYLSHMAETHLAAGNLEPGLAAVAEGLATAERSDEQFYLSTAFEASCSRRTRRGAAMPKQPSAKR
jgi:hypothetical protein